MTGLWDYLAMEWLSRRACTELRVPWSGLGRSQGVQMAKKTIDYDTLNHAGRTAHEVAEHDKWFRAEVQAASIEANDPATQWISHEEAKAEWAQQRAEWLSKRHILANKHRA
jgi:hypothetical protein